MTTSGIACTLQPDQLRDRVAFIDALVRDALLDQTQIPGGLRARLRGTPGVERRVRDLVAAESACCAFLSFAVGRDEDGALRLDVTGPPEALPVIEQFFAGRGVAHTRSG